MNDLINRKKLLDEIDNMTFYATLSFPLKASKIYEIKSIIQKLLDSIIEIIKNSPSESGWIPCSERLPVNREIVLFTINRGKPKIGCGYRIHSERGGLLLTRWFDKLSGLNFSDYDVTAWMPMPDAYEPPEEGDNDA